jgi:aldehyde dehydrogenase (NAD+)
MSTIAFPNLIEEARASGTLAGLPDRHFIAGRFVPNLAGGAMEVVDPGRGEAFMEVAAGTAADVDAAVGAARAALAGPWSRATPAERGRVLARAAALIRDEAERLAIAETLTSGKPVAEARGDIGGVIRALEYYAGACDKFESATMPLGPDYLGFTVHEPVGIAAQIIPWNYPLSTFARGVAPALAAGCAVVVKPADQTPLTALMAAEILTKAGLPDGVLNVVTGTGKEAGAPLVAHPGIDHITFTGSVSTGIGVMKAAAENVTRLVLELGGKSPVVVLADADLDAAVEGVMGAIFENAGQICSAGSRLIVERKVHAELVARLVARAGAIRLGHGLCDVRAGEALMGPVNSLAQQTKIAGFVDRARARGRVILCGGEATADPATGKGWFYRPTIIDNLPPGDEIVTEEIFGPVLAVQIAEDAEHAAALANGTRYALCAGIYTRDFTRAHRLARQIDAGQVFINEYFAGGIEMPFGGNRHSGFGREKGIEALRSYSKLKSIAARL